MTGLHRETPSLLAFCEIVLYRTHLGTSYHHSKNALRFTLSAKCSLILQSFVTNMSPAYWLNTPVPTKTISQNIPAFFDVWYQRVDFIDTLTARFSPCRIIIIIFFWTFASAFFLPSEQRIWKLAWDTLCRLFLHTWYLLRCLLQYIYPPDKNLP